MSHASRNSLAGDAYSIVKKCTRAHHLEIVHDCLASPRGIGEDCVESENASFRKGRAIPL